MYQLGWFSTGRDKAARDLLEAIHTDIARGKIKAEIAFVFISREPGEFEDSDLFIKMVENYHIPLVCFSYQGYKTARGITTTNQAGSLPDWRLGYDREVMSRLHRFHPDICVLAGYMLIAGNEMCQRYNMINLHPSAPGGPTGTWQEVIWQLIESQADQTGVIMHLVTPELDRGPLATCCIFPIRGEPFDRYWKELEGQSVSEIKRKQGEDNPLFRLIRRYGMVREFPLITATIKTFSEGKIRITPGKQVVDFEGRPVPGYDLTDDIEKVLGGSISYQAL